MMSYISRPSCLCGFASQSYDGRVTQPVIEQFTVIVKNGINQFINERLNERLKSALVTNNTDIPTSQQQNAESNATAEIETTQEERDAFNIVKAILREIVDVKRIYMRDAKVIVPYYLMTIIGNLFVG